MSTQYHHHRSMMNQNDPDNHGIENQINMMAMAKSGSSSTRIPLRSKPLNTVSSNVAYDKVGSEKTGPSIQKSSQRPSSGTSKSKSGRVEVEAPKEIEELRRKPNGEGHTVHRYIRGKMLGKGGFAKVYMCTSLDTNRSYAVKVVPKANLVKSRARQKLQAEIKIHRSMKHKHICEYKHFFEDKNNCYILLELCDNQSMNELIKRRKRLTEPEVKYYLSQLLESIQYMHGVNVIHRDLKLGNLFLDKHLRIKVGDFGLASKLAASDEKRKTICGTPNYIAPEVIDGDKEKRGHSFEVDVWSMGVIFFTLLIGKPPYESKDVKSTYQRILRNEYSFPSHIPISQHARDLIASMLQTRPDNRPSLDTIQAHPFFTHDPLKIPKALPSCCTHVAPDWQEDGNGCLVPVLAEANEARHEKKPKTKKEKMKVEEVPVMRTRGHSEGSRTPSDDIVKEEKHQYQSIQQTSSKQMVKCPEGGKSVSRKPHSSTNHFEIYGDRVESIHGQRRRSSTPQPQYDAYQNLPDENGYGRSSKTTVNMQSKVADKQNDNELYDKLHQCTIQDTLANTKRSEDVHPEECNQHDVELKALEIMYDRLRDTNAGIEAVGGPTNFKPICQASSPGAKLWVTRYVDYTSKYGLGFLFNDGSAGVYFNDSTKAVLGPNGDEFVYVERKKLGEAKMEQVPEHYTLSSYPESLQKKVTLLKHFRNYLVEQHKEEDDDAENINNYVLDNKEEHESSPIFLKKWVRTKHAILFRLSNQTVQVVFYDHTEILLSSEARIVTFVNKKRGRNTYYLEDIMTAVEHNDIKKRLKYAEGILQQLISTPKK